MFEYILALVNLVFALVNVGVFVVQLRTERRHQERDRETLPALTFVAAIVESPAFPLPFRRLAKTVLPPWVQTVVRDSADPSTAGQWRPGQWRHGQRRYGWRNVQ